MYIDLSLFEKLKIVFKYLFSSFMSIELSLIVLVIFLFLFFNIKRNKKIVNIVAPIIILLFLAFMAMGFHNYSVGAFQRFIEMIIDYYYFPSMALYFIMMFITTILLIYFMYSDKYSIKFKILNYVFCFLLFSLFVGLSSYVISNKIKLSFDYAIYKNSIILSFVQISNLLFWIWIVVLAFIKLYSYFRKKFD